MTTGSSAGGGRRFPPGLRDAPALGDVDLAGLVARRRGNRGVVDLKAHGWSTPPTRTRTGGTGYERDGIRVELTFIVAGTEGEVLIAVSGGTVTWSQRRSERQATLGGATVRGHPARRAARGKVTPRADPRSGLGRSRRLRRAAQPSRLRTAPSDTRPPSGAAPMSGMFGLRIAEAPSPGPGGLRGGDKGMEYPLPATARWAGTGFGRQAAKYSAFNS